MSAKEGPLPLQLLTLAHPEDRASTIFKERVKDRPLHLKPTESSNPQPQRRLERQRKLSQRKKKLKPAPLSARQKRTICLHEIPREAQKYDIYEPLRKMWVRYIQEVLWDNNPFYPVSKEIAAKLCSADFHGAELEVARSRCVSRVGVKGIVVKDSKFVFEIITPRNEVKIIPKEHTIFRFSVPRPRPEEIKEVVDGKEVMPAGSVMGKENGKKDLVFELHGDQFEYRAADRANRKFKSHFLSDL
jgi:ribonuclease P protein subunit POP4